MTRGDVLRSGVIVAVLGLGLAWAGIRMARRPEGAARAIEEWSSRRWMREDEVPSWVTDAPRGGWGVKILGRFLAVIGFAVLAWGARVIGGAW